MKKIFSIFLSVLTVFTLCFNAKVNVNAEGTYTVYSNLLDGGTLVGETTASSDADYSFSIKPNNDYLDYPSEITVKVGIANLDKADYIYDSTTGKGTIPKEKITENISISGVCYGKKYGKPIVNIYHGTNETSDEVIAQYGVKCTIQLHNDYANGYLMPNEIRMTIDGKAYTGFTYSADHAWIQIPGDDIKGEIVVNIACTKSGVANTYNVTSTTEHCTFEGDVTASSDADYKFKITPDTYYGYPFLISSLKVGGIELNSNEYTYSNENGEGTIPSAKITGDISIVAKCEGMWYSYPTVNITNGYWYRYSQPQYGVPCTFGLFANDGYTLPRSAISMTIDGKDYTGFEYDITKGYVLIPGEDVVGEIVVNATCVSTAEPNTYKVTQAGRPGVGYKFEGEATATEGEDYRFKFSVEDGYQEQGMWAVINGKQIEIEHDYNSSDLNEYYISGSDVTGDIEIHIYCETMVEHLQTNGFTDIESDTPHLKEVYYLIVSGVSEGWKNLDGTKEFRPYAFVARADMAAFLKRFTYRYLDDDSSYDFVPSEEDWTTFTDVVAATSDQDKYHQEDILWLAKSGISKGWENPDGTKEFRPFSEVTRADMAAFLRRLAAAYGLGDAETWEPSEEDWATFIDVSADGDYHQEDILWLAHAEVSTGWIEKDGTKTFRPYQSVARCDMAAFLDRLGRLERADDLD